VQPAGQRRRASEIGTTGWSEGRRADQSALAAETSAPGVVTLCTDEGASPFGAASRSV